MATALLKHSGQCAQQPTYSPPPPPPLPNSPVVDVYEVLIGADGVRQSTMFKGRNGTPFARVDDPTGPDAEGPCNVQINPPASGLLTPETDPFRRLCAPWSPDSAPMENSAYLRTAPSGVRT